MNASDTAVQHVAKIQNIAGQLRDVGEQVSDATIIAKILASLTPKYGTLQTAWDNVDPNRQTIDHLQERLIREDIRLSADSDAASALAASKNNRIKQKSRKSKKEIECYRCHEMGHFALQCKNDRRKKDDGVKTRDRAFVAKGDVYNEKCAPKKWGETTCNQKQKLLAIRQSEVWITDSGTSKHLTYRREWLIDYRANRNGDTIALNDDGVCDGNGTVLIKKLVDGEWQNARIENVSYVKKNLFSVGVCTEKGFEVRFRDDRVLLVRDNRTIASGVKQKNNIY